MAKKDNELITDIEPISLRKKFIQPVAINQRFTSFVAFKHVKLHKVVGAGSKAKEVQEIERTPLMFTWDGKKINWFVCQNGQEVELDKRHYIIDRDIDDNPMLPSEEFIGRMMSNEGMALMKKFKADDFFEEIHSYLERYFHLEKAYLYKILTLFIVNCWVFDAHESTPYLFIRSPVRGCGKSHLGESISWMCNGQMNTNFKAHHLFRIVHGTKTIGVFDEIKKWTEKGYKTSDDTKDILSLVNVGFQRGGSKVPRLVEVKGGARGEMKTILYDSFSPKVMITTTGQLPADTASRCIEIIIQRAPPKGIDYGDRWYEPERKQRLKKIREMGFLFRLKYGKEVSDISENVNWRDELDIAQVFKGLRNRELEIFRPLVILTLKYKTKWKEMVNTYVRKYNEMRSKLEPTPVNNVLWAMRSLYNDVVNSAFECIQDEEYGEISIEMDEIHGAVFLVPPMGIAIRVQQQTALELFGKDNKYAASKIGKILNDLGFISGKKRTSRGMVRIVKVKQLEDMVERYLGMKLIDADEDDGDLDNAQRVELVRDTLKDADDGLTWDEFLIEIDSRMTEDQLKATLKHLKDMGGIEQRGKAFYWVG